MSSQAWLIVCLLVAARLLLPLLILRYPLGGILSCLVLDSADQSIMQAFGIELPRYQGYDKALDVYYLSIAYFSTMRNWENLAAFQIGRVLFYLRVVGVLVFELTGLRLLLAVFPNAFEPFFIYFELVRRRGDPLTVTRQALIAVVAVLWLVVKLPHEWWIHVAQLDGTDFVKTKILGAEPTTLFWKAIVQAPAVTGTITVTIAVLALALWRFGGFRRRVIACVKRLGQWTRPAVPRRLPAGVRTGPGWDRVAGVRGRTASTLRPRVLVEKIVLVTLVAVIFQQTLPGLLTSGIRTAVGIALVVVAADFLVRWELRRFGVARSPGLDLAVTGAVNFTVVLVLQLVVAVIRPGDGSGSALIFACLVTLFVTMYDHYRPIYEVRRVDAAEGQGEPAFSEPAA